MRTRVTRRRREVFDGTAELEEDARLREMRGRERRTVGGQVGPASELEVKRFELSRGVQKQRGGIAPVAQDDGDLAAEQSRSCALEPVKRVGLRCRQEPLHRVERSGEVRRLRRGQRALRASRRVDGELDRPLQERGGCGHPAARLRPTGRPFEFERHLLVGPGGGAGAVPRSPVRVGLGVGGIGERAMDAVAVLRRRRAVGGGSDERVRELDALTDREQSGVHRGVDGRMSISRVLAAAWSRTGSPSGSAVAARTRSCVSGGSRWRRRT